jgi:hypothetical protein
MPTLMKAIAKRAPAKVLLPALYEMWPSLKAMVCPFVWDLLLETYFSSFKANTDVFIAYFGLLKKALRSAARPAVLEHLRPLFKVFLEAFDELKVSSIRTQAVSRSLLILFPSVKHY